MSVDTEEEVQVGYWISVSSPLPSIEQLVSLAVRSIDEHEC